MSNYSATFRQANCRPWRSGAALLAVLLLTLLVSGAPVGLKARPSDGWDFSLKDTTGKSHSAAEWRSAKSVALLFIATECPVSNGYAPEINRIFADYSAKGVVVYAVHSDPDVTQADAQRHAESYGYRFTVLLDPAQTLAKKFGVTVTP